MTENYHKIGLIPKTGIHTLTVIDNLSNEVKKIVEIN